MTHPSHQPEMREFRAPRRYVAFLWTVLAWVQAGLLFLWQIPWYQREATDLRSWLIWACFDLFLIVGSVHATLFRVRTRAAGLEYLKWTFRWERWDWDEVIHLERRSSSLGARYRVRALRGSFGFAAIALEGSAILADTIVDRADLDDLGEVGMSLQAGTLHVWRHPSAEG